MLYNLVEINETYGKNKRLAIMSDFDLLAYNPKNGFKAIEKFKKYNPKVIKTLEANNFFDAKNKFGY